MKKGENPSVKEAMRESMCARLAEGESLSSICRDQKMPAWSTVHEWMDKDEEFAGQVMRAREAGYHKRAEAAVEEAKSADDAGLGRLAFDAERWYLGKLSNAFGDNKEKALKVTHDIPDDAKAWLGLKS